MKRRTFIAAIAVGFLVSAWGVRDARAAEKIRVSCVGDSITFGAGIRGRKQNCYPAQLQAMLGEGYEVRNFGVSGRTLLKKGDHPYWKTRQFKAAHDFKPNIVVIKLGTNDTKPQNWKHKDAFVADYLDLIKGFQAVESKPTVWICKPVPAYPGAWGIRDKIIQESLPMIDDIAKQAGVGVIDLYTPFIGKKELFPDKVHPNAAGSKAMAEVVKAAIGGGGGWQTLFNGKDLTGWKAAENPRSFSVKDGLLIVKGPRGHLFYSGDVNGAVFKDFHLQLEVMTKPKANSGVFFHTKYQGGGWPRQGYEAQVNSSHRDWRRTGSVYAAKDVSKKHTKDNQWFVYDIIVKGKTVTLKVDGETINEYTEKDAHKHPTKRLGKGTIAIQAHDPGSEIHYRSIKIKVLD
jgi:lysophospholipase L1-like esterase